MSHHGFKLPFSIAGRAKMREDFASSLRPTVRSALEHYTGELEKLTAPTDVPHSFDLRVPFEELSLFPGTSPGADGIAIVGYSRSGFWVLVGLELDAWRVSETVMIPTDHPLFRLYRDAIQQHYTDTINALVEADLEERGWVQADPNEEHRLGARQLGVGL